MSALARTNESDCYTRAANEDSIYGGPRTRTKYIYDANGNVTSRNGSLVHWTSYNYPSELSTGYESAAFNYGPDRQRWKMSYSSGGNTETTYYATPMFEEVTNSTGTEYRYYVYAANRPVVLISRSTTGSVFVRSLLTNHQDSISTIVDNSTGALVAGESFTAYGLRREASTWSGSPTSGELSTMNGVTREGYTFQTVLGEMGLNHMNGRIEDAASGRFLSADPHGINPLNTQSYNRYSYVNNNPLTLVDPTGFDEKVLCDGCGGGFATYTGSDGSYFASCTGSCGGSYSLGNGGQSAPSGSVGWVGASAQSQDSTQSINGGSDLGNFLRGNVGLVGGILGDVGDILSGLGNIAGGIATFGQFGSISTGLSELGGGVAGLAQIGLTDLTAGLVGAAGYAYNLGANAINVLSLGNLRSNGSLLSALGTLVGNAVIPDYGLFGGPNWGVNTVGANPQYALNSVDYYSEQHDVAFGNGAANANYNWVQGNFAPTPGGMIPPGPLGIAYSLLGALPFGLSNPFFGQGH
jgi:RHS repeat-associated protein